VVGYFVVQTIRIGIIVIVRANLTRSSFLLPEIHQRRVDGDARQPGSETRPTIKIPHVKECAQERVLNRIFGVLNASGDSVCDTKGLRPLSFGERVERHGMASLGGFHEA